MVDIRDGSVAAGSHRLGAYAAAEQLKVSFTKHLESYGSEHECRAGLAAVVGASQCPAGAEGMAALAERALIKMFVDWLVRRLQRRHPDFRAVDPVYGPVAGRAGPGFIWDTPSDLLAAWVDAFGLEAWASSRDPEEREMVSALRLWRDRRLGMAYRRPLGRRR